jgi:hypothetical protein
VSPAGGGGGWAVAGLSPVDTNMRGGLGALVK